MTHADFSSQAKSQERLGTSMFRFTIRDVLWLTVVVALAVGGKVIP